jgi:aminoglycoside N3'-acetyltransferase
MTPAEAVKVGDLVADLRRLGVQVGDIVMVHASLRRIGAVDGRAAGVVQALDAAVGPAGTVLMNVGPADDWGWVNDRPESERAVLLADAEPFDPLQTPTDPEIGVLAEVFRQQPGTLVSNHPEGRFGARGRLAERLTSDVPWDDYYGPGSPLERLVELHGKVLRLGADIETVTLLHYAEYLAPLPNKRRAVRYRRVLEPTGPVIRRIECLHDSDGIVDYPGGDYFGVIMSEYLATGRAQQGTVGPARSELIDAADLVAFAVDWMTEHLSSSQSSAARPQHSSGSPGTAREI